MKLQESKEEKIYTIQGEKVKLINYYDGICYYFIKVNKDNSTHGRYAKELNTLSEKGLSNFPKVIEKEILRQSKCSYIL